MAEKPAPPKITDAEFEVVTEAPEDAVQVISRQIATIIGGLLVVALGVFFGVQQAGHAQTFFGVMATTGLAAALRGAWSLFATLRRQRSATKGERRAQASQRISSARKKLR
jgi:Na+/melibiose symporter-like transporter